MFTRIVRKLLYPASCEIVETPDEYGCDFDDISFSTQDGCRLQGWWIPREGASVSLIFCYGNGENVGDWASMGVLLDFLDANIFLFDYRGYGDSDGSPSELGISNDARAAFDIVSNELTNLPVVVMGRSLGGAVAIEMAVSRPVAGLVVESTFTCIADMAKTLPVLKVLPKRVLAFGTRNECWQSESKVGLLDMPTLFAHSKSDRVVPFELGKRLYQRAPDPKHFCVLKGGHNDVHFKQKRYRRALLDLVDAVKASRT